MKTLYLELNMGAAGDMLLAALLELHPNAEDFLLRLNNLGIPGTVISAHPTVKCGISGTQVRVVIDGAEEESQDVEEHSHHTHAHSPHPHDHTHAHPHDHHHAHEAHLHDAHSHPAHTHHGLQDIVTLIRGLDISAQAREDAVSVYRLIAEAESAAHNAPVEQIHFHEVGNMDAATDIVGVCMLIDELGVERILASPIRVGHGQVKCAHGILPVPAPATAYILKDVPIYGGEIRGELCTPTGAALLKHFVSSFCALPTLCVQAVGYGMGKKDFPAANCVRAFLGVAPQGGDDVAELSCNLDDMTAEDIAFAQQTLLAAGALEVYTCAIGMKKGRPGILLTCMCRREQTDAMVALLFQHTSTLGIRESVSRRYTLHRTEGIYDTPFGPVRYKRSEGYGAKKTKLEYEDLAEIARKNNLSLSDIRAALAEYCE